MLEWQKKKKEGKGAGGNKHFILYWFTVQMPTAAQAGSQEVHQSLL